MNGRALLLAVAALALLPGPARAEEADAKALRERKLSLAGEKSRQAMIAWQSGDAKTAAELWAAAVDLVPDDPVLQYDLGVALERAGDRKKAADAYKAALSGGASEHEDRALFNLGAMNLDTAWKSRDVIHLPPQQLAEQMRTQLRGPDGEPLSEQQIQQTVQQLRQQALQSGLEAAKESVRHLKDLVRRNTADREAAHNLQLAQRVLRDLIEEQKNQQQQHGDGEDSEKSQQQSEDSESDSDSGQQENQDQPSEDQQQKDESTGQQDQQQKDEEQTQEQAGARDISKEEAERMLEKLLEAAARRMREVRERRQADARRAPVEKDW